MKEGRMQDDWKGMVYSSKTEESAKSILGITKMENRKKYI